MTNSHSTDLELIVSEKMIENSRIRAETIDKFIAKAVEDGGNTDRLYWTLIYDFEHAPVTTNFKQLEQLGVVMKNSSDISDEELPTVLNNVFKGLEKYSIYLIRTNHLTDRDLYERLTTEIFVEEIRDLPPNSGVHEYIDLTGGGTGNARMTFESYYGTDESREELSSVTGLYIMKKSVVSNRDESLPKPILGDDDV